jgi:short-subunit dehydrogenase
MFSAAFLSMRPIEMPLTDRKIVMTGASGGIGRHVAELLLRRGAELVAISRSGGGPPGARYLRGELSTDDGIAAASAIVASEQPDILLNLAGIQYCGPVDEQALNAIRGIYMVNLVAPVALCNAALPSMRQRRKGQIVNIGSTFGSIAFAHFANYSSTKAGLRSFSEALRRELVDTGIGVTYVAPRAVRTAVISPRVEEYARITGMVIDDPSRVAARIVDAIERRKKEVYIGFPESIFVRMNALMPRIVDRVLAGNDRKAKRLFAS